MLLTSIIAFPMHGMDWIIVLLFLFRASTQTQARGNCSLHPCPGDCVCCSDGKVKCNVSSALISPFLLPSNTKSLTLVGHDVSRIGPQVFSGLMQLESLNLSFIGMQEWAVQPPALMSLRLLDLSGNHKFMLKPALLQLLPSLVKIRGATWSEQCTDCTLTKPDPIIMLPSSSYNLVNATRSPIDKFTNTTRSPIDKFTNTTRSPIDDLAKTTRSSIDHSGNISKRNHSISSVAPTEDEWEGWVEATLAPCEGTPNIAFQFASIGFKSHCQDNEEVCAMTCELINNYENGIVRKLFLTLYPLGVLGMLINSIVIATIITSKKLRKNVSMILFANMSACDIMLGIYSILAAKHEFAFKRKGKAPYDACKAATALFTIGEMVSVTTAVLMTVEKYLAILYCMEPDKRMRRKHVAGTLCAAYVTSLLYSLSIVYSDMGYSMTLHCSFPVNAEDQTKQFILVNTLLIWLYLTTIPLYVRIAVFVSRSGAQAGIKRDAALAKNLAVLIGINLIFFIAPMSLIIVNILLNKGHTVIHTNLPTLHYIVYAWLPYVCLAVNSVINPFIYVLRRRQFRREFIACACVDLRLTTHIQRAFSFISLSTRRTSTATPTSPRGEVYNMSQHPEPKRMRINSQIVAGAPPSNAVVLCKFSDKSL
ncbi:uncharacterized protein LOC5515296 isoform X2 [Nematostella vectensis]|uniref:uncharacterized protein LOC5515296 isoform X2 n=1 Tax=Nematostella vectensis TaxID=45351 RepID=UPI00207786A8|nr:uncharacterized protein LOC5515296 isoform X2 [Nematostella vectensis]